LIHSSAETRDLYVILGSVLALEIDPCRNGIGLAIPRIESSLESGPRHPSAVYGIWPNDVVINDVLLHRRWFKAPNPLLRLGARCIRSEVDSEVSPLPSPPCSRQLPSQCEERLLFQLLLQPLTDLVQQGVLLAVDLAARLVKGSPGFVAFPLEPPRFAQALQLLRQRRGETQRLVSSQAKYLAW
jgi:hypothetical protein